MNLSSVSKTSILTMICRAVASAKDEATFHDPMAALCLELLTALTSGEDREWILREKRLYSGLQINHALAGARRSQVFDRATDRFIADHAGCTVVNLGCGFDTRYWRIGRACCRYLEVDLPEVIALKREVLGEWIDYEMIGCPVMDPAWVERVGGMERSDVLMLAEGLFCYVPEAEVRTLLGRLAGSFKRSRLVLDTVPLSYTKWPWTWFMALETRFDWGLSGVKWAYGIEDAHELEGYAPGLKVLWQEKGSTGPVITLGIHEGEGISLPQ